MALTLGQANDQYYLSGVTQDPNVTAPLGRIYVKVGNHWLGFDDRFTEPVIVRAYYDIDADPPLRDALQPRGTLSYVGYMQFMRMSFRGSPVPPSVYQGQLADRQPYVYGTDQRFIDFMGPSDARLRDVILPFYPFNAMLLDGTLRDLDQFMNYPLVNGSLRGSGTLSNQQAVAPLMVAEITSGLLVPGDITPLLTVDNLLLNMPVTNATLAAAEPYRIALDWLKFNPVAGYPGDPPLAGIDEKAIAGQVIGDYVLLTLPDPENFGGTLVVSTTSRVDGANVIVHVLSEYDVEGLTADVGRQALWRIHDYHLDAGTNFSGQGEVAPQGRGMSGLYTPPYSLQPGEFALALEYWTTLVGVPPRQTRASPLQMLGGIAWAALLQYDENTGQLSLDAIRDPHPAVAFDLTAGLAAYQRALTAYPGRIDVSNFTRAAMRRDDFSAGSRLRLVTFHG